MNNKTYNHRFADKLEKLARQILLKDPNNELADEALDASYRIRELEELRLSTIKVAEDS